MAVRKYWRHMLGVDVALFLKNEPRERKVAFMNHICENKMDGDVKEMVDSKSKLLKEYELFSQTKLTI
jgi:hypothetical protein